MGKEFIFPAFCNSLDSSNYGMMYILRFTSNIMGFYICTYTYIICNAHNMSYFFFTQNHHTIFWSGSSSYLLTFIFQKCNKLLLRSHTSKSKWQLMLFIVAANVEARQAFKTLCIRRNVQIRYKIKFRLRHKYLCNS